MIKKNIFQYWNTESPPHDVQENISGWINENTGWMHFLYNDNTARKFLTENFDEPVISAYDSCNFPQMRSDLFRLAILYKYGGVYVDAGIACIKPLDEWVISYLEQPEPTFVRKWHGSLMNGFMISKSGNELIMEVMLLAVSNTLSRVSNNIHEVTGPAVLNKIAKSANMDFYEIDFASFTQYVRMGNDLSYKKLGNHWSEKQKNTSIYI